MALFLLALVSASSSPNRVSYPDATCNATMIGITSNLGERESNEMVLVEAAAATGFVRTGLISPFPAWHTNSAAFDPATRSLLVLTREVEGSAALTIVRYALDRKSVTVRGQGAPV